MATIFLTFIVMTLIVAAMAIGVIVSKKPIKGSCGGLSALGMKESCEICGGDQKTWRDEVDTLGRADLAYDATSAGDANRGDHRHPATD